MSEYGDKRFKTVKYGKRGRDWDMQIAQTGEVSTDLTPDQRARFEAAAERGLQQRRESILLDGARNAFAGGLSVRDGLERFEVWRSASMTQEERDEV